MNLDRLPDYSPVQRVKIINEDAAVWITHLHRGYGKAFAIHDERIIHNLIKRWHDRHRYRSRVELRLAQLRLEHKLPRRRLTTRKVSLQPGPGAEPQFFPVPEFFVVEISNSTTSPVAGESGFTAIGIENATSEIRHITIGSRDDRDPIATRAVMPVADLLRKCTEISN